MRACTVFLASMAIAAGLACPAEVSGQASDIGGADGGELAACALSASEVRWIQSALDGWERVSAEFLEIDPSPLPWLVLFDESCAWHLAPTESRLPEATPLSPGLSFAGEPVPVRAMRHDSALWQPSGSTIPVQAAAFASLYEGESGTGEPFVVFALPEVWSDESGRDAELDAEMGVFSHEIVHTRQITALTRTSGATGARA